MLYKQCWKKRRKRLEAGGEKKWIKSEILRKELWRIKLTTLHKRREVK